MCIDLNNNMDRELLKDVIGDVMTTQLVGVNEKLSTLSIELEYVKKQVTETNGKVKKHEQILTEMGKADEIHLINHQHEQINRAVNCPHSEVINELKQDKKVKLGVKGLIVSAITLISLMLGIAFTTIKLNQTLNENETDKIEEMIEKAIKNNDISYQIKIDGIRHNNNLEQAISTFNEF